MRIINQILDPSLQPKWPQAFGEFYKGRREGIFLPSIMQQLAVFWPLFYYRAGASWWGPTLTQPVFEPSEEESQLSGVFKYVFLEKKAKRLSVTKDNN